MKLDYGGICIKRSNIKYIPWVYQWYYDTEAFVTSFLEKVIKYSEKVELTTNKVKVLHLWINLLFIYVSVHLISLVMQCYSTYTSTDHRSVKHIW